MRENLVFVKNIHTFFLKCNYISNNFGTFEQPYMATSMQTEINIKKWNRFISLFLKMKSTCYIRI